MTEPAPREGRFTCQDGLSLYYRDYGDPLGTATPVLCLSGLTRNTNDFDTFARRVAKTRRVVAMDYRGRGRSDRDPDWRRYVPPSYLADADQLLTALNIHKVVLVGTSLGGILAMAMAAAKPTRLRAVVMNDVGPEIGTAGLGRILTYVGKDDPQPDWETAERKTRQNFPDVKATDEQWKLLTRGSFQEGEDGILHVAWDTALVKPFLEPQRFPVDLWRLYGALRDVPTLVLRGAKSDILSADTLERMKEIKPDLRVAIVPDVGHVPILEEPESRTALDAFLSDIP